MCQDYNDAPHTGKGVKRKHNVNRSCTSVILDLMVSEEDGKPSSTSSPPLFLNGKTEAH